MSPGQVHAISQQPENGCQGYANLHLSSGCCLQVWLVLRWLLSKLGFLCLFQGCFSSVLFFTRLFPQLAFHRQAPRTGRNGFPRTLAGHQPDSSLTLNFTLPSKNKVASPQLPSFIASKLKAFTGSFTNESAASTVHHCTAGRIGRWMREFNITLAQVNS